MHLHIPRMMQLCDLAGIEPGWPVGWPSRPARATVNTMRKSIVAKLLLSATCMFGLSACGGIIQVQRAVEAKGYEVEKVGVSSDGHGRTLTVYTEKQLDAAQTQEVVDTAKTVYPKAQTVNVVKGDGSGVSSGSSGGSKPSSEPRKNHG